MQPHSISGDSGQHKSDDGAYQNREKRPREKSPSLGHQTHLRHDGRKRRAEQRDIDISGKALPAIKGVNPHAQQNWQHIHQVFAKQGETAHQKAAADAHAGKGQLQKTQQQRRSRHDHAGVAKSRAHAGQADVIGNQPIGLGQNLHKTPGDLLWRRGYQPKNQHGQGDEQQNRKHTVAGIFRSVPQRQLLLHLQAPFLAPQSRRFRGGSVS